MEKLKRVLSPGSQKDDQQLYGSGNSADTEQSTNTSPPTDKYIGDDTAKSHMNHSETDKDNALHSRMGESKEEAFNPDSNRSVPGQDGPDNDAASRKSMKSGVLGTYNQKSEDRGLGPDTTHGDRAFPLRGGAVTHENDRPTSSVYSGQAAGPSSISANIDPSTTSNPTTEESRGLGPGSGSAAIAGAGAGATAASLAKHSDPDHRGHSHQYEGDPCVASSHSPEEKTLPHMSGPHNTVAANMLDPHVPGEFPADDGQDPHGSRGAGWFGEPDPSTARSGSELPSQTPEQKSDDHHYGRDAAVAGGAGVAGLGTYAATKNHEEPAAQQTPPIEPNATPQHVVAGEPPIGSRDPIAEETLPVERKVTPQYVAGDPLTGAREQTQPAVSHESNLLNKADPRINTDPAASPVAQRQYQQEQQNVLAREPEETHHGRNAALAGAGAGAAGYGAYEVAEPQDTGPASKTIGPHKSNLMNIIDPRVRPEPEKMKGHETAGPWQSDVLNKMDPKVESDPAKAEVPYHGYASGGPTLPVERELEQPRHDEHHYGRDAALLGGAAGAGGAAAYGANQYDEKAALKEQERLAKEHHKQMEHDAKEADKRAKHDAEHAHKEHRKEQEKLDKQHSKEAQKLEKQHLKEAEKHEQEQEKLEKERAKEDEKLAGARKEEADKKRHEHNKLHKDPPEEREKKGGIMHRIFHHKHHERAGSDGDGSARGSRASGSFEGERPASQAGSPVQTRSAGEVVPGQTHVTPAEAVTPGQVNEHGGVVAEKYTGLPMNAGSYGSGAGVTDGSEQIAGYHAK